MTRKDYVLLADALNAAFQATWSLDQRDSHRIICATVAVALAKDNPRFDRARFLTACGVAS